MKRKGFILTMDMAVAVAMGAFLLLGGTTWAGIGWIRDFRSDLLREECNLLENAVRRYGQNHLAGENGHLDAKGAYYYTKKQTYPASQKELSKLHDLGYLPGAVKFENFQWRAAGTGAVKDTSVTFYKANSDSTKYRIEVVLPNGSAYVTPGSSSF